MPTLEAILTQGFGAGLMLGGILALAAGRHGTMAACLVGTVVFAFGLWLGA